MSGYQEGVYLDISLFKVLNDQSAAITETKKPIRLTISIPEELRKDGRTFVIYREHNGVVELLKDLDNDPATVTIESDQFSVFALAYSDGQAEPPLVRLAPPALLVLPAAPATINTCPPETASQPPLSAPFF